MTYGIAYGSFSEIIHIGRLNKAQSEFVSKEDHTIPAALAVVEWVTKAHGGEVDLAPTNGGTAYRITVSEVTDTCTRCDQEASYDGLCATHSHDEYGYTPAIPT